MKLSIFPICEYCLSKIPTKYILCIPCNIELCLKCFCNGVEGFNHRKTHTYRIEDPNIKYQNMILKDANWNYDEELEFINAVGIYKSGNWTDIAAMVQSKNSEECRKHFVDTYIEGDFGRQLISDTSRCSAIPRPPPLYDHTQGVSSPMLYERYPPSLMSADEEKSLGYLPRRNDFLMEYDDGAEKMICAMNPDHRVGSIISAIHVTLIDMYKRRLLGRHNSKRICLEHGLTYHLMARVLEKSPRDYQYFHRQLQRRTQCPSTPRLTGQRQQSIFGRNYVKRARSIDRSSGVPSTSSEYDHSMTIAATPTSSYSTQDHNEPPQEEQPYWHYNASLVDHRLSPFLRYLSSKDTKLLLQSITTEGTLKSEIRTLQKCVSHGIRSYQDYKTKLAALAKHKVKSPSSRNKAPKRKRGRQRCFQFVYMMRKKRLEKYLDSLKVAGSK